MLVDSAPSVPVGDAVLHVDDRHVRVGALPEIDADRGRTGVGGGDAHRRRGDVGELLDRLLAQPDQSNDDDRNGNHARQDRTINKCLDSHDLYLILYVVFSFHPCSLTHQAGLPDPDVISSFSKSPYNENGVCYTTVVTTDGAKPTIYKIDPETATATAGLTVEADEIGALGLLKAK